MSPSWQIVPYTIPLAQPLVTATHQCSTRQGLHVVLTWGPWQGLGDLATWPGFGEPLPALQQQLRAALAIIAQASAPPEDFVAYPDWAASLPAWIWQGPVGFAIELALLDWYSQQQQLPLRTLLHPQAVSVVHSHQPIVGQSCYQTAAAKGGPLLGKVKWLPSSGEQLLRQLGQWQGQHPHPVALRLDGNGAFTLAQLHHCAPLLQSLHLAWIEQPLPVGQEAQAIAWAEHYQLPLAFDESITTLRQHAAWRQWAKHAMVVAFVLKPMYLAGLRESLRFAKQLRAIGKQVIWTHTFESSAGRMAVAQLAAADAACASQAIWHGLAKGPMPGPSPDHHGQWHLPARSGLGITLEEVRQWHDR